MVWVWSGLGSRNPSSSPSPSPAPWHRSCAPAARPAPWLRGCIVLIPSSINDLDHHKSPFPSTSPSIPSHSPSRPLTCCCLYVRTDCVTTSRHPRLHLKGRSISRSTHRVTGHLHPPTHFSASHVHSPRLPLLTRRIDRRKQQPSHHRPNIHLRPITTHK
jgi:hypothetical protein